MPPIQEITVDALADKLRSSEAFILLDVREPWELECASIRDPRLLSAPMSLLAEKGMQGLPEAIQATNVEVLVLCHHGVRSAQVAGWLSDKGRSRVLSVAGGIDEYALRVDPTMGKY